MAQSSLTTSYAGGTYLSSLDGGVYFDLQVQRDLSLTQIDVNLLSPSGTPGTLEVWVRPGTWVDHVLQFGDWVQAASGPLTAAGAQQPSTCLLATPIGLPPGSYGIALHLRSVIPIYSFAFGQRTFGNNDLSIRAGGSATQFLASTPFLWRVFNGTLHYTVGGGPYSVATVQSSGAGCRQAARSCYEFFPPGSLDLSFRRFRFVPNTLGGYDVTHDAAPPLQLPAGAQNLGLVHDSAAFVPLPGSMQFPGGSTATLLVLADGRVLFTDLGLLGSLAPPSAQELLGSLPTLAAAWMDLAPLGSANVYVHTDPLAGSTSVIWWQVPVQGAPAGPTNTFALTVRLDGSLELSFAAVQNPTNASLVGFGAGPGARDPGPRDLSQTTTFTTSTDDPGLGLVTDGRPVLGTTTTLRVVDLPTAATWSVMMVGWRAAAPSLDLGAYGAPGCWVHIDPNPVVWTSLGTSRSLALAVPNAPWLLGVGLAAQAAAMVPAVNALGIVTSNGLVLAIGGV